MLSTNPKVPAYMRSHCWTSVLRRQFVVRVALHVGGRSPDGITTLEPMSASIWATSAPSAPMTLSSRKCRVGRKWTAVPNSQVCFPRAQTKSAFHWKFRSSLPCLRATWVLTSIGSSTSLFVPVPPAAPMSSAIGPAEAVFVPVMFSCAATALGRSGLVASRSRTQPNRKAAESCDVSWPFSPATNMFCRTGSDRTVLGFPPMMFNCVGLISDFR